MQERSCVSPFLQQLHKTSMNVLFYKLDLDRQQAKQSTFSYSLVYENVCWHLIESEWLLLLSFFFFFFLEAWCLVLPLLTTALALALWLSSRNCFVHFCLYLNTDFLLFLKFLWVFFFFLRRVWGSLFTSNCWCRLCRLILKLTVPFTCTFVFI